MSDCTAKCEKGVNVVQMALSPDYESQVVR